MKKISVEETLGGVMCWMCVPPTKYACLDTNPSVMILEGD